MNFFQNEPIEVITRTYELDELGEVVGETQTVTETEVLVCPISTTDLTAARPNGDTIAFNIHFKKGWNLPLSGASVRIRGELYRVEGEPQHLTEKNCPTPYNLKVSVVRVNG